jgi:tight adherence protein B
MGRRKRKGELQELESFLESPDWTPGPADQANAAAEGKSRRSIRDDLSKLDLALDKRGLVGNIRSQLRKANLKLTITEYLLAHVLIGGGLAGAGLIILDGNPMAAGLGVLIGLFGPRIYVTIRQKQRLNSFNDQLPDILGLWVNSLRAGFSVQQAMEAVSREAPTPSSEEFKRVVNEIAIGIPMEVALTNMLARIESEDLDLVFTAVNIQREVGGNLAEILDTISHTIRERIRIKGEIRTLTASGRATGTIIGLMPVILVILLSLINKDYMGQLFFGPPIGAYIPGLPIPCGWPIIALGLIMMGVGMAIIQRITDIEV